MVLKGEGTIVLIECTDKSMTQKELHEACLKFGKVISSKVCLHSHKSSGLTHQILLDTL